MYYRGFGGDNQRIFRAEVEAGITFTRSEPETLFRLPFLFSISSIHPDGRRFVMHHRGELPERSRVIWVQNWFEELKRLVPTE